MDEALCSMLTGEAEWVFDSEGKTIKFNKDGTGELRCTQDGHFWIAAMHDWKMIEREQPASPAPIQQGRGGPEVLGSLHLQITLLPRTLPPQLDRQPGARAYVMNERGLHNAAFAPKRFAARLERGNFIEPAYASPEGSSSSGSSRSRYALRLVFDRSPYPAREEWASPERGPDGGQFWEIVEFVGRKEEGLKKAGRAMNDGGGGGGWMEGCVVS